MTPRRMHLDIAAVVFLLHTKPRTREEICSVLGWQYADSRGMNQRLNSILTALEQEGVIARRKVTANPPRTGPRTTEFYWLHLKPPID